jgi:hypothetical protein
VSAVSHSEGFSPRVAALASFHVTVSICTRCSRWLALLSVAPTQFDQAGIGSPLSCEGRLLKNRPSDPSLGLPESHGCSNLSD